MSSNIEEPLLNDHPDGALGGGELLRLADLEVYPREGWGREHTSTATTQKAWFGFASQSLSVRFGHDRATLHSHSTGRDRASRIRHNSERGHHRH